MAEDNKPFIEEVKDYIKVEIDILKINLLEKMENGIVNDYINIIEVFTKKKSIRENLQVDDFRYRHRFGGDNGNRRYRLFFGDAFQSVQSDYRFGILGYYNNDSAVHRIVYYDNRF